MSSFPISTNKKKKRNKRRFSDEQIKSLETIFESESKLEPMKKMQLAKELGLQPRQIAIWFQNRRARWKSKQLEQDYSILKANYDNLAVQFESLEQEKQSLVIQLQKLCGLLGKPREAGNSTDGESENGDAKVESDRKPSMLSEGSDIRVVTSSNNENDQNIEYVKQEGDNNPINMKEHVDGVPTSPENWSNFNSCGLFDQPCSSSSQWWDFWS